MNIALPPEQMEWLRAEVDAGRFSSIDEALAIAVADLIALTKSDLTWAKPYADKARESFARGEIVSESEYTDRIARTLKELRSQ